MTRNRYDTVTIQVVEERIYPFMSPGAVSPGMNTTEIKEALEGYEPEADEICTMSVLKIEVTDDLILPTTEELADEIEQLKSKIREMEMALINDSHSTKVRQTKEGHYEQDR